MSKMLGKMGRRALSRMWPHQLFSPIPNSPVGVSVLYTQYWDNCMSQIVRLGTIITASVIGGGGHDNHTDDL